MVSKIDPVSDNVLPFAVPARVTCVMTVAGSGHPWTVPVTDDPVIVKPTFQFLLRPASARLVHVFDATMFIAKLPDEKSFGADPGAVMLPQAETKNTQGRHSFLITVTPEAGCQAGSAIVLAIVGF